MARQKWTCGDYAQQSERTKRQKYDARVQLQQLGISERDADKLLRAAGDLAWLEKRLLKQNPELKNNPYGSRKAGTTAKKR